MHKSNQHPAWRESDAFDQLMETDPQWLRRGVGDPTGLRMPARAAATTVATCAPPWDAHAGKMLMSEDCPNVPLSLLWLSVSVLFERQSVWVTQSMQWSLRCKCQIWTSGPTDAWSVKASGCEISSEHFVLLLVKCYGVPVNSIKSAHNLNSYPTSWSELKQ